MAGTDGFLEFLQVRFRPFLIGDQTVLPTPEQGGAGSGGDIGSIAYGSSPV